MAKPRKAPPMPVVPTRDGEVERRNAYTRLNPKGDEEFVVKRQGKQDEETLNELVDDILSLIEDIEFSGMPALSAEQPNNQRAVNQSSPPQLVASRGDPARAAGETLTNMTVAPQTSEMGLGLGPTPGPGPDIGRALAPLAANARGDKPISKYITDENGLDFGATRSECFTGTGAIAMRPSVLGSPPARSKWVMDSAGRLSLERPPARDKDTTTRRLESDMTTRRRPVNEWSPPFKAAGYNPGEHTMPEPSGKGVADRTPTQDKVGAYDTELSGAGKEWPRAHKDTEAMCDVGDDGVDCGSGGQHESTHGEADDGHQKKVGHDWPAQPKNSGQGVAEPFEGERWSDGGTLKGSGPGSDTWGHHEGPGMPSDGPITGTDGPQNGHVSENRWSPERMAGLMGEDVNLQALFDSYARNASAVCLEDFQNLCDAHGCDAVLDEASLLSLMDANQEFVFYEGRDSDGPYWTAESTEGENGRPFGECNDVAMRPKKRKKNLKEGTISELQIRSPEVEAGMYGEEPLGNEFGDEIDHLGGDPDFGAHMPGLEPSGVPDRTGADLGGTEYGDRLGGMGGMDDMLGGEMGGMGEMGGAMECPGCGYTGEEEECPECGAAMMDAMGEAGLPDGKFGDVPEALGAETSERMGDMPTMEDDGYDPLKSKQGQEDEDFFNPREGVRVTGPQIIESLKNFMSSARSMIERNPRAHVRDLAEALNHSWQFHAGAIDPSRCTGKVRATLEGLMGKFPGFNPLLENEAVERPEGTKLGGGDGPKDGLPKQPTETTTHGDKSLLGKRQTGQAMAKTDDEGVGGDLWMSGTEKKMSGRATNEGFGRMVKGAGQAIGKAAKAAFGGPTDPHDDSEFHPPAAPKRKPFPDTGAPFNGNPFKINGVFGKGGGAAPTGAATKAVEENIARLSAHIRKAIREGAKGLRGKYNLQFTVLVAEEKPAFLKGKGGDEESDKKKGKKAPPFGGDKKDKGKPAFLKGKGGDDEGDGNPFADKKKGKKAPPFGGKKEKKRTPPRDNLAEALADAEEILQLHSPNDVTFEATFLGPNGQIAMKQDIPLFTINSRGPMVGEGKALFRFSRTAEAFAEVLAEAGVTCRIAPHNWGSAVQAPTNYQTAARAFAMLAEGAR
jgi:hypothetical protein